MKYMKYDIYIYVSRLLTIIDNFYPLLSIIVMNH